jgi:CTP synthase
MVLSDDIDPGNVDAFFEDVSGILVAPGFGDRGIEGKIEAVNYAREKNIPFFGICLGMQCAVIEYARNVCLMEGANSTEFDLNTAFPVIDLMNDQRSIEQKGGTMRLGSYECEIAPGTKAASIYDTNLVKERHRHRFELNNNMRDALAEKGMIFSGRNPDKDLVEIIELPDHRWYVAVQFHPEYKTTVGSPHPLFDAFVEASTEYARETGALSEPRKKTRKNIKLATAKL